MDIFVSWSGERSQRIALFLKKWIKQVLQETKPWVSTGIEKGASWDSQIMEKLSSSSIGIICLTSENLESNWIHFEAGALAKGVGKVMTLCLDIEPSQVKFPLGRFQATRANKEDVFKMVSDINGACISGLEGDDLAEVFETNWPKLESKIDEIKSLKADAEVRIRDVNDMTAELIESSRSLDYSLRNTLHWIMNSLDRLDRKGGFSQMISTPPPKPNWESPNYPYDFWNADQKTVVFHPTPIGNREEE